MLKNVVAERAIDQPLENLGTSGGPPRPHANFGVAIERSGSGLPPPISMARQLNELQRRSRDVLAHQLIRHPAASALRRLGQTLLANIRRIQDLGHDADPSSASRNSAIPQIQEIILSSHRLLDTIVAQITLCDSTTREALAAAVWGRRIALQEPIKLYKLMPLFDRVCDEIRRVRELRMLIPMPGFPLASVVASQADDVDAAHFVGGVMTARVLVWTLGDDRRPARFLARLVLAALLQDLGRVSVRYGRLSMGAAVEPRTDWLDRQHPAIGAALFGTVRGGSVEFPMLVAQHHEQLDGGGFPRALANRDILPDAAILATACRFVELCLMPSEAILPGEISTANRSPIRVARSAAARAAAALLSEAEWGKWPLDFSRRLAERVAETDGFQDALPLEVPIPVQRSDEVHAAECDSDTAAVSDGPASDRLLQLHDHDKILQGTHADYRLVNNEPRPSVSSAARS